MKKFISALLVIGFMFAIILPCFAVGDIVADDTVEFITSYQYPITVESAEWNKYSVSEKVEMLKISDDKLAEMTDEQLIQAIADYPYLVDIYAYGDSVEDGIAVARKYFSALDELLSRDTGVDSLATYGVQLANSKYKAYQVSSTENADVDLFTSKALMNILKATDVSIVSENSSIVFATTNHESKYIYTVDGNPVLVYLLEEGHTEEQHSEADDRMEEVYGVTLISPGSCLYNCHSYAWYAPSTSNHYWIDDPTPYMEGETYVRKYLGGMGTPANTTSVGYLDIIFYGDYEDPETMGTWHSAIYHSFSTSGEPLAMQLCRSKWGQLGVFEHRMCDVPAGYDIYNITAWRIE